MLKRVCCRCLKVLSTDHAEDAQTTHTFCLDCLPEIYPFKIERVEDMTPEMLDALPYGVVRLDAENNVIAYSEFEARLARRSVESVMGLNFFEAVAPCTNVQELSGWVSEARQDQRSDSKRLTFVFDFPHGRQLVALTLVHDATTASTTITVDAST